MKVTKGLLLLIALTAMESSARANLGEDSTAINTRYGAPTAERFTPIGLPVTEHQVGILRVIVVRRAGRSVAETFTMQDRSPFADMTIQQLLRGESGGAAWTQVVVKGYQQCWVRPGAFARYEVGTLFSVFATEGQGSDVRELLNLPEPVQTPAGALPKAPQAATASPSEVDKEIAWSGYQEGRRIGNRRFREGFPQPSSEYLDQITALVNADRLPMWKVGFKKGYLSAWSAHGQDL